MEHLISSRISKAESPTKLENLSPEKYGKAAFAGLSFTPSKLADNVLFREATNFKRIEQQSSKVRESQATISIMKDRVQQLQQERDGIEATLMQQVLMYKKMLNETELKHNARVKDIQKHFNEEMQRLVLAKEEEAKYAQSERELFQNRIQELEDQLAALTDRLHHGDSSFQHLTHQHQQLQLQHNHTSSQLEQTEKKLAEEQLRGREQAEELSRKLYNAEVESKGKLERLQLERQREKEAAERLLRAELDKAEQKRIHEAQLKNQEVKDLNDTFNHEMERLNAALTAKERAAETLSHALNFQKDKLVEMTREHTAQITGLSHERDRFADEAATLSAELSATREERQAFQNSSDKTVSALETVIVGLRQELQANQLAAVRDRDKNAMVVADLHRQILLLRTGNERGLTLSNQNAVLCREVRNLRDLLLESSLEMERCKEEFLRLGRQKDHLAVQVRELGFENETLQRIRYEKEEEARGWRDNYFLNRR